jgi:branched-chain amino acid transport system permease protein
MFLQQLVNAILLGSIFALFALGLSLAWGTLDVLNLAHGALFVLAGFVAFKLATLDLPFIVLVAAGMVAAGLLAVLMEFVAFGPVRRRFPNKRQAELSMLAVTVGAGVIIDDVVRRATGSEVFPVGQGSFTVERYSVGSVSIPNIGIVIVVVTLLVAVALDQWIRRSHGGMAVRAIAFSSSVPALLGVNVTRVAAATMFVSGALAGLAGVLLGVSTSGLEVGTGHSYLLKGFAIVVLGGVGSIRGGLIAAYIVGAAETAIVAYGPGGLRDAVAFGLILVVLLFRPQGLLGQRRSVRA